MKIRSDWDDDEIQFAGFGSASTITEYAEPRKKKRRKMKPGFAPSGAKPAKFKVGFAIPKKPKSSRDQSRSTRGVKA